MKNNDEKIKVNVVSGSLGAGKTTLILNMVKQFPEDYNVVWLKNEYGDFNIDSELARESAIQTKEILNGCLCCVLVGRLHDALQELVKMNPKRIIIETAGTAYPYPIISQIEKISELDLDSYIQVIDVINFEKFRDDSYINQSQAKFVDAVVLNKIQVASEEECYQAEEYAYGLYRKIPIIKSNNGFVDLNLLIGLDKDSVDINNPKNTLENNGTEHSDHPEEFEVFGINLENKLVNTDQLSDFIRTINDAYSDFYRIKGIVRTEEGYKLYNWVTGRVTTEILRKYSGGGVLTFMGKNIKNREEEIKKYINNE